MGSNDESIVWTSFEMRWFLGESKLSDFGSNGSRSSSLAINNKLSRTRLVTQELFFECLHRESLKSYVTSYASCRVMLISKETCSVCKKEIENNGPDSRLAEPF